MASVERFEDLEIWQLARVLCSDIHIVALNSDLRTDYKLYSQIDGSSGSAMDNIAEGFERNGNREFIQFLSMQNHLAAKHDLSFTGYLTENILIKLNSNS